MFAGLPCAPSSAPVGCRPKSCPRSSIKRGIDQIRSRTLRPRIAPPIARTSVTDPESPARNHCTAWAVCHTNDMAPSPIAVRNDRGHRCGPEKLLPLQRLPRRDHHQALLLESAGRRQVPIPDRHNSSTEEFRPPHQDHSHATARCPIAPTVIDAEPSCVSGLPASPPRTGDRCSFTHRDRGAVGSLALRASRAPPFPSAPATLLEPHRARAAAQQAPGMSAFRGIGGESPFGR